MSLSLQIKQLQLNAEAIQRLRDNAPEGSNSPVALYTSVFWYKRPDLEIAIELLDAGKRANLHCFVNGWETIPSPLFAKIAGTNSNRIYNLSPTEAEIVLNDLLKHKTEELFV